MTTLLWCPTTFSVLPVTFDPEPPPPPPPPPNEFDATLDVVTCEDIDGASILLDEDSGAPYDFEMEKAAFPPLMCAMGVDCALVWDGLFT